MANNSCNAPLLGHRIASTDDSRSVIWMQKKLNRLYPDQHIKEDNLMGPETRNLIKRFQRDHHLAVDGIVGRETYPALLNADTRKEFETESIMLRSSKSTFQPVDSLCAKWDIETDNVISALELSGAITDFASYLTTYYLRPISEKLDALSNYLDHSKLASNAPKKKSKNYKEIASEINKGVKDLQIYGFKVDAIDISNTRNVRNSIMKHMDSLMERIKQSKIHLTIEKYKEIVKPITDYFKKHPVFARILGVGGSIINGIFMLGPAVICLWEGDIKGFEDKITRFAISTGEGMLIAASAAAFGGLVPLILLAVFLVFEYFFLSDTPGESMVDNWGLKTRNLITSYWDWTGF